VFVYTGVTTAEIEGPTRQLAGVLDADVVFVAADRSPVVGVEPVREVRSTHTFDDAPRIDVLVLPGGLGWKQATNDAATMAWLRRATTEASGILAISTGSLLLAATGELAGQPATGHWLARDALAELGASVSSQRTEASHDRRVMTASGALAAQEICVEFAQRLRWGP